MASAMALVPDAHLGVVVLSNMHQADARFAIIARVLQDMLDVDALYKPTQLSLKKLWTHYARTQQSEHASLNTSQ
jgi:cobyrinic acid a,c-diamide synthase